jgi:hypothetical protein
MNAITITGSTGVIGRRAPPGSAGRSIVRLVSLLGAPSHRTSDGREPKR